MTNLLERRRPRTRRAKARELKTAPAPRRREWLAYGGGRFVDHVTSNLYESSLSELRRTVCGIDPDRAPADFRPLPASEERAA